MIPKKFDGYDYPIFQPDQLLSADHLNHSFTYNEQEERLTRTNLIGIGIVCGLKATPSADGSTISISKGTGVTSQGYLITHGKENSEEAISYRQFRPYVVQQSNAYEPFWADGIQKYALYELLTEEDANTNDSVLDTAFMANKVCLLFYELQQVEAKNCDTTSCDDKGTTITVTVRKLLIHQNDAREILAECYDKANISGMDLLFPLPAGPVIQLPPRPMPAFETAAMRFADSDTVAPTNTGIWAGYPVPTLPPIVTTPRYTIHTLPELRLPKYDVTATTLETPEDIRNAYQKIFSRTLVAQTATAFNAAYNLFKGYLGVSTNPFTTFAQNFAFLHDGDIEGHNLLHFQYYYDFFCDLFLAYSELKESAGKAGAICTPPEALFPRHLFLGKLTEAESTARSEFRSYFIPSPIVSRNEDSFAEFKNLFDRLARMVANLDIPTPQTIPTKTGVDTNIRITPSLIGNAPLGSRAIPYYYNVNKTPEPLLDVWSYPLRKRGQQKRSLSYHATAYNLTDTYVRTPLAYDIEPYNFFRIEGHVGKTMETALAAIKTIRDKCRLPFDVVPVNADALNENADLALQQGYFNDLETQYQLQREELKCKIGKAADCLKVTEVGIPKPVQPNLADLETINLTRDKVTGLVADYEVALNLASSNPRAMTLTALQLGLIRKEDVKLLDNAAIQDKILTSMQPYKTALELGQQDTAGMMQAFSQLGVFTIDVPPIDPLTHSSIGAIYTKYSDLLASAQDAPRALLDIRKDFEIIKDKVGTSAEVDVESSTKYVYLLHLLNLYLQKLPSELSELDLNALHAIQKEMGDTYTAIVTGNPRTNTDCLKPIKDACLTGLLDTLFQEYKNRLDKLQARLTLAEFSKAHPGLQHKAGVPVGGTFILVYKKHKYETSIIDFPTNSGPVVAALRIQPQVFEVVDPENGIVIADFYLPYLCCSDCPPVQVSITPTPPTIIFELPAREYCSDYTPAQIPFLISPLGGTIESNRPETLKTDEAGNYVFVPGNAEIPENERYVDITFTYRTENTVKPYSVRVYREPQVTIDMEKDQNDILYSIKESNLITAVWWDFGDGTTGTAVSGKHTYATPGKYLIQAQVQNGTCTFTPEPVEVEILAPEKIEINLPDEFCQKMDGYHFSIKPAGGTITGILGSEIKEEIPESGEYMFYPQEVNTAPNLSKKVSYIYTAPAGNTRPFSVTVYAVPKGTVTVEAAKGGALLHFRNLANVRTIEIFDGVDTFVYTPKAARTFEVFLPEIAGQPQGLRVILRNGACSQLLQEGNTTNPPVDPPAGGYSCQSLNVPLERYRMLLPQLKASDGFFNAYGQLENLTKSIDSLRAAWLRSPQEATSYVQKEIVLYPEMISSLPINNPEARTLSLQVLAVLTDLVTTISCLKMEDANNGIINTYALLKIIQSKLSEIQGTLNPEERTALQDIEKDLKDEKERLDKENPQIKPNFEAKLKELMDELQAAMNRTGTTTPATKYCQSFSVPAKDFQTLLPELQSTVFTQAYGSEVLMKVSGYFSMLYNAGLADESKAVDYVFKTTFSEEWITALPLNTPETRSTALKLLAILTDLMTTTGCYMKQDITAAMPFTVQLGYIKSKIKEIPNLKASDLDTLAKMQQDISDERMRIMMNSETMLKETLNKTLADLYDTLTDLKNRSSANPPIKSCQSFSVPLNDYQTLLPELQADTFAQAYGAAGSNQISNYFNGLNMYAQGSEQEAYTYTATAMNWEVSWTYNLPVNDPANKVTALKLLAIITDVLTTAACHQPDDIGPGPTALWHQLTSAKNKIMEIASGNRTIIEKMQQDIYDERMRLMINVDTLNKPTLNQTLADIQEELANLWNRSEAISPGLSCQPLGTPISDYLALLPELQSTTFTEYYDSTLLADMTTYFNTLNTHWQTHPDAAIAYVLSHPPIQADWITQLPVNIPETKSTALALLAILGNMLTTISCLKENDVNAPPVSTGFEILVFKGKIAEIDDVTLPQDLTSVQKMQADIADEQNRIVQNNATGSKVIFAERLTEIDAELTSLLNRSTPPETMGE